MDKQYSPHELRSIHMLHLRLFEFILCLHYMYMKELIADDITDCLFSDIIVSNTCVVFYYYNTSLYCDMSLEDYTWKVILKH